MLPGFDPNQITNLDGARQAITLLLNLVEELKQENDNLRGEVQHLRDEINRLKGEQGKPTIKPGRKGKTMGNISSEQERRQAKPHRKNSKIDKIEVNREEKLLVDRDQLPPDAQFKGYVPVIIQEIELRTNNVRFLKDSTWVCNPYLAIRLPEPKNCNLWQS
jgi:regulator of replication initiation timing